MKRIICICIIISLITSIATPVTTSSKSTKIIKQPLCSMKQLYYYTEDVKEECKTNRYKIKKKYWKQAKIMKNKVLKCKKKVFRIKYKTKKQKENTVMTYATMIARYIPFEENIPRLYSDFECCEISVKGFKKSLKKAKQIRKKINAIVKYLKINKRVTKIAAMQRFNSWIIGQMTYKDSVYHCTTYDGFFNGIGVCRTYTYLFRHLCNRVGIECYAVQTVDHEFNAIPWGERTLYTDVCWNDTGTTLWCDNTLHWFMINKKQLYKDHDKIEWEDDKRIIKH